MELSLSPINFFQISANCFYIGSSFPSITPRTFKKFLFPKTSKLCCQEEFADVAMGWSFEGIEVFVNVKQQFSQVSYPSIQEGDSIELFFDTRDVKTSGYNTRFCHHFYFLPEAIEGKEAGEITRFRTEDLHEKCDPDALKINSKIEKDGYKMNIFIPSQCLYGYDPDQFDRLGFTYRINRFKQKPQHFSVISSEFPLEQQPSLWSSLRLIQ